MSQNNTPATQQPKSVANFLNLPNTSKFLEDTLKDRKTEFVSNLIAMCDSDANLSECDPAALMKCAMNATAMNLSLNKNLGLAYIIPYKKTINNVSVSIPNFQLGYKGYIQLAIRSGQYRFINVTEIREGEIQRNKITGEVKFLEENLTGKVIGYNAYLELLSGFTASLYMTEEQIEEHAFKYSKVYQNDKKYKSASSKWSDPVERPKMAKKTVLKGLLGTWGILSTEMQKAFESDNEDSEFEEGSVRVQRANSGVGFDQAEVIQQDEPKQESGPVKI